MPRYRSTFPVRCSPERAWEVLTCFPRYGEWNPQISSLQGEPTAGSTIKLRLVLPGRPAVNLSAVLDPVIPPERLGWKGHVGADWLFCGEREFVISAQDGDSVSVTHDEHIRGLLAPVFGLFMGGPTRISHHALNEAFQKRCESTADRNEVPGNESVVRA